MLAQNGYLFDCDALDRGAALVSAAVQLGATSIGPLSASEARLANQTKPLSQEYLDDLRQRIRAGDDPLGDAFCRLRSPAERRTQGATFTPKAIVDSMVRWAAEFDRPTRVVDPGTGSARYLLSAAKQFPHAELIGIEIDPLAALLARANLAVAGLAKRTKVLLHDFCKVQLPPSDKTFFVGNPPYVRHHLLKSSQKKWLTQLAAEYGHSASQLAGLHVHFFMATLANSVKGDFGAFITAAEWLDVNYGSLIRQLFLTQLGGQRITIIEPTAQPFPDAATTAAITHFQVQSKPKTIYVKRIATLNELDSANGFRSIRRERWVAAPRWSQLTRAGRKPPTGYVELGELCRVHRGQVTGFNKVWIADANMFALPESVLFPTVTKARELFQAGKLLTDSTKLRRVIDLPVDLSLFDTDERRAIDRFLARAKALGTHLGYVASNRKAWWSVGLRQPAPILTTYMARRPPAFVHNQAQARHINIAHGVYPRERLGAKVIDRLVEYLSNAVSTTSGRTYAGGLTKFEPREVERLWIPGLDLLASTGWGND